MRKIIALEFITLDGVIQAGGGPEEDTSGGSAYGGWKVPYGDDVVCAAIKRQKIIIFIASKPAANGAHYFQVLFNVFIGVSRTLPASKHVQGKARKNKRYPGCD